MAEKKPKKRAEKYNEKVKAEGTFGDLLNKLFPKVKTKQPAKATKKTPKT